MGPAWLLPSAGGDAFVSTSSGLVRVDGLRAMMTAQIATTMIENASIFPNMLLPHSQPLIPAFCYPHAFLSPVIGNIHDKFLWRRDRDPRSKRFVLLRVAWKTQHSGALLYELRVRAVRARVMLPHGQSQKTVTTSCPQTFVARNFFDVGDRAPLNKS